MPSGTQPLQAPPAAPTPTPGTFGPGNNLINQQLQFQGGPTGVGGSVSPNTGQLSAIAQQLQQLAGNVPSFASPFLQSLMGQVSSGLSGPGLASQVGQTFAAQQPIMDQAFNRNIGDLNRRTAALGRPGGGFVNVEGATLADSMAAQRDALLANLSFQANQADAQNRLGLIGAGGNLAGQQFQRQNAGFNNQLSALQGAGGLAGQAASIGLQGQLGNQADLVQKGGNERCVHQVFVAIDRSRSRSTPASVPSDVE